MYMYMYRNFRISAQPPFLVLWICGVSMYIKWLLHIRKHLLLVWTCEYLGQYSTCILLAHVVSTRSYTLDSTYRKLHIQVHVDDLFDLLVHVSLRICYSSSVYLLLLFIYVSVTLHLWHTGTDGSPLSETSEDGTPAFPFLTPTRGRGR